MTKKTVDTYPVTLIVDTYPVTLKAPKGHVVPPLLAAFGAWLAEQPFGSLGDADGLAAGKLPADGWEAHAARINVHGFELTTTADGSSLVLLDTLPGMPVVCLGGEGDLFTVGDSLEAFLLRWSVGETGVMDLDDEEGAEGRQALAAWLKKQKVKAPASPELDFEAWLEARNDAPAKASTTSAASTTARRSARSSS